MTDKQPYYKLDEIRVIGLESGDNKNYKKYHANKTANFFKALRVSKPEKTDKSLDQCSTQNAVKKNTKVATRLFSKSSK